MEFDKDFYEKEFKKLLGNKETKNYIRKSNETFKISHFKKLAESSLLISKDIKSPHKEPDQKYWFRWSITISYYSILYSAKSLILSKGYETGDHYATQIALGYLCVPDEIEKEDLELLNQAHKIFEDEYIKYFEDARKEARISRYNATKTYTERRTEEIFENARKFVAKISLILS
ncbi:MAG: HEPN domain-containing protein [Nanoarchaeota archaeon]